MKHNKIKPISWLKGLRKCSFPYNSYKKITIGFYKLNQYRALNSNKRKRQGNIAKCCGELFSISDRCVSNYTINSKCRNNKSHIILDDEDVHEHLLDARYMIYWDYFDQFKKR